MSVLGAILYLPLALDLLLILMLYGVGVHARDSSANAVQPGQREAALFCMVP